MNPKPQQRAPKGRWVEVGPRGTDVDRPKREGKQPSSFIKAVREFREKTDLELLDIDDALQDTRQRS